ncbi:MAG: DUF1015 domain-containing protein [Candidatus Bathyarchaeota archaeon]|nr:DUF1015 domain-containing protein [Candidatus Bathyarchaeota archaeon]
MDIRPFKAITYTPKAGDPKDLITQPYDKIDVAEQKEYYALSNYNFCRLILPLEDDKYAVANQRIEQWLKEGAMTKQTQPAVFVSRQEFILNGKAYQRTGIIAALRLYPYSENMVFPHEATYKAPKADRLNMLRTVQKDLEPVFLMYQDQKEESVRWMEAVAESEPMIQVTDALGVHHTVWRVSDPQKIGALQAILKPKPMVITDGHHRYESALAYRDEMRAKTGCTGDCAFNFYMCYMVPVQEEGLIVLPTHRLLKNYKLTPELLHAFLFFFDLYPVAPTVEGIEEFLASHQREHVFCVYDGAKAYGLQLKHDTAVYDFVNANVRKETKIFDVVILRDIVFRFILKTGELCIDENIMYIRWTKAAMEKVNRGEASIAFMVNPVPAKTIAEIAVQHEMLPEKSTDFYPKLVSGLVLMDVSVHEKL